MEGWMKKNLMWFTAYRLYQFAWNKICKYTNVVNEKVMEGWMKKIFEAT